MKYATYSAVPSYSTPVWTDKRLSDESKEVQANGGLLWGGKKDPPPIGREIHVTMNSLGAATVLGYFSEGGWLGLLVKLHNPPEMARETEQGRADEPSHIFGVEYSEFTPAQLDTLKRKFEQSTDGSKDFESFCDRFRPMIGGYIGGNWCGMFLGIEKDGHAHT